MGITTDDVATLFTQQDIVTGSAAKHVRAIAADQKVAAFAAIEIKRGLLQRGLKKLRSKIVLRAASE